LKHFNSVLLFAFIGLCYPLTFVIHYIIQNQILINLAIYKRLSIYISIFNQ